MVEGLPALSFCRALSLGFEVDGTWGSGSRVLWHGRLPHPICVLAFQGGPQIYFRTSERGHGFDAAPVIAISSCQVCEFVSLIEEAVAAAYRRPKQRSGPEPVIPNPQPLATSPLALGPNPALGQQQ